MTPRNMTSLALTLFASAFLAFGPLAAGESKGGGNGSGSTGTGNSGNSGNNSNNGNGSGSSFISQTGDLDLTGAHSLNLRINGNVTTINGSDHNLTGARLSDQTNATTTVGLNGVDGSWINGTSSDTFYDSSVVFDGIHNDQQVTGAQKDIGGSYLNPAWPVQNNLNPKWTIVEQLVQMAKNGADYTIDLSSSGSASAISTMGGATISLSGGSAGVGSPTDFKVVYASGKYVNGVWTENNLHLSGQGTSYGLLVIEVRDATQAQFIMSGQHKWVGLVVMVCDTRLSGNRAMFEVTGGGNNQHIVGAALLYNRNNPRSGASIYGQEFYRTNGQADLAWSSEAVNMALNKLKRPLRVRSWRVVD